MKGSPPIELTPFEAQDWPEILAKIIEKREMLGLSQEALGDLAGLPDGYVGRLEAWKPRNHPKFNKYNRGFGAESLGKILYLLGLKLRLEHVPLPKDVFAFATKKAILTVRNTPYLVEQD